MDHSDGAVLCGLLSCGLLTLNDDDDYDNVDRPQLGLTRRIITPRSEIIGVPLQ